jgi:hypothetical protein
LVGDDLALELGAEDLGTDERFAVAEADLIELLAAGAGAIGFGNVPVEGNAESQADKAVGDTKDAKDAKVVFATRMAGGGK